MKETELFPSVKQWLEERDYDVYAEVTSITTGGRADVVGVSGPAVAVVEMKNSLTLEVVAQALRWTYYANYIFIAVRASGKRRINRYVRDLLHREGVGLLEIVFPDKPSIFRGPYVFQAAPARFHRRIDDHIREELTQKHKELPGGHHGGGYVTTYSKTIDRVKDFLRYQAYGDWATLDDILNYCETHWSSPRSSLAHALRNFESDWCETKKENRKIWYRVKQEVQ